MYDPPTAKPYGVLPVDVDPARTEGQELLIIISDPASSYGERGLLIDLDGCTLNPLTNAQGADYEFNIGGGKAGVGCADITGDELPDLVGLSSSPVPGGRRIVATQVVKRAGHAVNGSHKTSAAKAGSAAYNNADRATCGSVEPVGF